MNDTCEDWSVVDEIAYAFGNEGTRSDIMRQTADESTRLWRSSHDVVLGQYAAAVDQSCRILSIVVDAHSFFDGGIWRCDGTRDKPWFSLDPFRRCHSTRRPDGRCWRCHKHYETALE